MKLSIIWRVPLRLFFSLFYDKCYLKGYYFEKKKMGWYWCLMGLPSRIWVSNRKIPWPVDPRTLIANAKNIEFDINDIHIFQTPGCYWQDRDAIIVVGKGCYIAPNVGIITTNHNINDVSKHVPGKDVIIGEQSWIGMNAVILPGVELGPKTVVGAGSVVTHSFPKGNCVIAGNPAKIIKQL